jgi:hypothetical protein
MRQTYRAKCPAERELGNRAASRLRQLVAGRPLKRAAHNACAIESRTVPIVFVNIADPVGAGYIESAQARIL